MSTSISYQLASATRSHRGDDKDTHGTWMMCAAITLLVMALVFSVASASFNPTELSPETFLVGP